MKSFVNPLPAGAFPPEYSFPRPDHRTPLVVGGEVAGILADPALAEGTRRFLEQAPGAPVAAKPKEGPR